MAGAADGRPPSLSTRQSAGCFAVAAVGLAGAAICIVLGVRCIATTETFDCIGLLTVFPAMFLAVALVALAIGWRRFVTVDGGAGNRRAQLDLGASGQPLGRTPPPNTIPLPGRTPTASDEDRARDETGE